MTRPHPPTVAASVLAAMGLVVGACQGAIDALAPPRDPIPCEQVFNVVRCLAIRDSAANQLGTTREDVVAVEIVTEPTPETHDGITVIRTTSGAGSVDLRVTLADGSTRGAVIRCAGIPDDPGCFDDPRLVATSAAEGGYRDVPAGSSPVPSAAPDAVAAGRKLLIERLDIPIDHVGPYEVLLGEARLPNGLLTTATFKLVDDWPPGITILSRRVDMHVRSAVDGRMIRNIYEHGWREGAEPVEVFLVFDVFRFDPGAVLSIKNVLVR